MAINPHIAHHTGRYRRINKTKKSVLWKLIQPKTQGPIIHFVEHQSKSRQTSLYLDNGNNQLDRDEDILLSRHCSKIVALKQRKGRFEVDIYRIVSAPDFSDNEPGWVGPGRMVGIGSEISMDNELSFTITEDLF
ncbi:hypothetical protein [Synechococcus sp. MIT S1220]|uniref:hypothetical protein n=1 Tax=Synechococcus sp. MIT S1220 TaxID=3082549 RepID=UPI0039AF0398